VDGRDKPGHDVRRRGEGEALPFERGKAAGMREYKIAAIPADGIGQEVIAAGLEVLQALEEREGGFRLRVEHFPWGSDYYRKHGRMMAEDGLERLKPFDAIYFGAVGAPDIPDHVTLWGLRLPICQGFDQYANVRPTRILPGITAPLRDCGPEDLDWVIVRENSEGEYAGNGGRVHRGLPEEVATETSVFTRVGVSRIIRFAFELAQSRPRKKLTVVTKSNAQRHGMVMWDEIAAETARDFPDVAVDKELVDAMTTRMVLKPRSIDTVVATNLHADILSDLAAALAGSLGIAPTANLDPQRRFPSMFEPIHGSAFDITGKGIANPIATFWTGAMMLEHLGEKAAGARLMAAVERVTRDKGLHTPDLGGSATTRQVTEAVCDAIRGANV
jgi:tartrate dehydrogenase/decarboxylase/D-malate dehydrogenase